MTDWFVSLSGKVSDCESGEQGSSPDKPQFLHTPAFIGGISGLQNRVERPVGSSPTWRANWEDKSDRVLTPPAKRVAPSGVGFDCSIFH